MTNLETLEECLADWSQEKFLHAANYLMDSPRRGHEREFYHAEEMVANLEQIILELAGEPEDQPDRLHIPRGASLRIAVDEPGVEA